MSGTMPQVPLLVEPSLKAKTMGSGSKVSLFELDSDVRATSVCNELFGDVRNMVTGFLKINRMEPSTSRRNNVGRFLRAGPGFR